MVKGFGGVLTQLTEQQKNYLDLSDSDNFKDDGYKY